VQEEHAARHRREMDQLEHDVAKLAEARSLDIADLQRARSAATEHAGRIPALQAQCDQLQAALRRRDDVITKQSDRLLRLSMDKQQLTDQLSLNLNQLRSISRQKDALRRSRSYQLGNAVLRPLSRIKRWLLP
jgi:hypothetical protein